MFSSFKFLFKCFMLHNTLSVPVPSAPPANVTATALSSTQILVSWDEVPFGERNGDITHYEVMYNPLDSFEGGIENGSVTTVNRSILLEELEEYVTYNISVRAQNSVGVGPFSVPILVTTPENGMCTLKGSIF